MQNIEKMKELLRNGVEEKKDEQALIAELKAKCANRYRDLIGKSYKTKSGTQFKVLGMVSSTAFGALFVVEYAGSFKLGTMLPKTVEECACQVPLKNMTEEEAREEIKRFKKQWLEDNYKTYPNPRR